MPEIVHFCGLVLECCGEIEFQHFGQAHSKLPNEFLPAASAAAGLELTFKEVSRILLKSLLLAECFEIGHH